jgi:hypothetical protein
MAPALMVCWIDDGASDFLFAFCLAAPASYGVIAAGTRRRGAVCIAMRENCFRVWWSFGHQR